MQIKYWKNLMQAVDGMQKISAMVWSPNSMRLAVANVDRIIHLFNDQGERKDKFPTKPQEKGNKSYVIRALEFSPDNTKLAIAQSDNIVFIYKIGSEWGDKKSICNKFPVSSSVTTLIWTKDRHNELVFGLADGKIKLGTLRNNKSATLYSPGSYCVSLSGSRDGDSFISGHLDGSVYVFHFNTQQFSKILTHHSIPYALGWGEQIVCAGNDQKVTFYDSQGNLMQRFDYTNDDKLRDFTQASVNPSGETIILGNFNRFYMYNFNKRRGQWEELFIKNIENYYTVTSLCWKQDGSKFAIGSLCGSVDIFDASLRKIRYKGKFEFNYVSANQVVIKTISTGNKVVIKSDYSAEITRINILSDRFLVANTTDTLLIGDIETTKISEIPWRGGGNEKFDFSNPNIGLIFNAGELTLVEFGDNEPIGTCRTEFAKPSLISVRVDYSQAQQEQGQKVIAFLLDQQTIQIQDLKSSTVIATVNHDTKIDFIELNAHANKLLFRDKRRQLYIYNCKTQAKNTLLNYCSYTQWVPESEVVVAQNRNNLCVWYSIENPDKVTIYTIKGDVEEVQRIQGKTEVIVNEGSNIVSYTLDEPLIDFGFALESRDLEKAASFLDPLEMNPETEANWKLLAQIAFEEQNTYVAEHCYAALGDISKASYFRQINKMISQYTQETNKNDGINYYKVQAKLAMLEKQFHQAEAILLDHNEVEEAMEMYQDLHKWDESIAIAVKKNHFKVDDLKKTYYQWLLQTNQEEKAGEVKENEGDFLTAIDLYLKGRLPAKAANIVLSYSIQFPQDIQDKIGNALIQDKLFEKAGQFYENTQQLQKALNCYCKGNCFQKAVSLAKNAEPRLVVTLEERWGDWLMTQKQIESAVNHYIEAGAFQKAIEASILSRQWSKAIHLLQQQPPEIARQFFQQIAQHYEQIHQYDLGEKYYIKAGLPVDAFEMYCVANKWEQAYKVAKDNLPENEIVINYVKQAKKFENQGMYKQAEKLYLTVEQAESAINMYNKAQQYDNMIRLVSKHRKDLLKDTHLSIGQKYQNEGKLKNAEHHYIEAGAWHNAVEMYKKEGMWEQAISVSKINGSDKETCELAKKWAESLGAEQGMKMLLKLNLTDAVIEYLTDKNDFDEAFKMAQLNSKHKIPDVHFKYACFLEDERRFKEAEDNFIKAGKPQEAINMYETSGDFMSALQVARQYDQSLVQNIYLNQGKAFYQKRELAKAEQCFIQAKKPEIAIKMYLDVGNFQESIRVAKKHKPELVKEINEKYVTHQGGNMSSDDYLSQAKLWEQQRDYQKAIDSYLEMNEENTQNHDQLEEAWERAVQIALNYDKQRAQEIIKIVCKRLKDIKRFQQAAELLENVGLYEEAIAAYISGNTKELLEKAKSCCQNLQNQQLVSKYIEAIDRRILAIVQQSGEINEQIKYGDIQGALNALVEKGDWTQCLSIAEKHGDEVLNHYLMRFAKFTMEKGKFNETLEVFSQYGIQPYPQNFPLLKTLVLEILLESDSNEIVQLKNILFQFCSKLPDDQAGQEFKKYQFISHLYNQKLLYEKHNLTDLLSQTSVALLRYSNLIRFDKLYLDAGQACRKNNQFSFAFVLLNKYLDIYEIIEDPDNNNLEEDEDFKNTDIPSPFDASIPEKNLINEQKKEQIRDWLLQVSTKQQATHMLPMKKCPNCSQDIYEASCLCKNCGQQFEPCIITGYPITKDSSKCKNCQKAGNAEAWKSYLRNFTNCPWCQNPPS